MEKSKRSHLNMIAVTAGLVIVAGLFFYAAYHKGSDRVLEDGIYNVNGSQAEVIRYGSRYRIRIIGDEELYYTATPFAGVVMNYFKYDDSQEFEIVKDGDTYSLYNNGDAVAAGWRFDR